ncbi:hypothetical protein O6H91_15G012500 [Diphasiastrum complanatum]|nr:hypothetical protein O6H91_15G012500 [Diphasiastrum complanatum]
MQGDVHMDGKAASFILYSTSRDTPVMEEKIKPYTRKWEKSCMDTVHEVTLKSTRAVGNTSLICDVQHSVPAIVFTTGGYTGNLYHEFNDGLVPLYITSQHLKGEVVFIIVEFHNWWFMKYGDIVKQLSNYPVVDFENDDRIHCFPEVTVGLHIHDELAIDSSLMPQNQTIHDFRNVLDQAYKDDSLESAGLPFSGKPRMVIIVRYGSRIFQNLDQIVTLAEDEGFNVTLWKPDPTTELKKIYWTLNSSEVLMGVHGAAMTHFLFMRPGSVFVQVIPLGTKWAAETYYGDPAKKLGLQYLEYLIKPEESSLSDKYSKNDTVLTNPETIIKKGWWEMKEIYLEHQDVQPSLPRLRKTLHKAKTRAINFMKLRAG